MKSQLIELLQNLMRPPGGGIPTFSAGKGAALQLQSTLYGMIKPGHTPADPIWSTEKVEAAWRETFLQLPTAKVVLLGVPLDTGAGIRRGAAYGPRAVREELYALPKIQALLRDYSVVDLGDLYVNPHLLHDSMLSEEQITACQNEMYPHAAQELRSKLPVSALSQLKYLLQAILSEYPHIKIQVIGGDHSIAWPISEVMCSRYPNTLAIVQPDAHTDLLPSRLGVKYCFGTWSYHANQLLGGNGKLVQLGIRQSGRDRDFWEKTTGVKQYWADEIHSRSETSVIQEIITHLKDKGVKHIYFSNDIDGTDESEAPSTGTPAAGGLSSQFLLRVIQELGNAFEWVASDVVEVAPDLGLDGKESERTCKLAARYLQACIQAHLRPRGA